MHSTRWKNLMHDENGSIPICNRKHRFRFIAVNFSRLKWILTHLFQSTRQLTQRDGCEYSGNEAIVIDTGDWTCSLLVRHNFNASNHCYIIAILKLIFNRIASHRKNWQSKQKQFIRRNSRRKSVFNDEIRSNFLLRTHEYDLSRSICQQIDNKK